MMGITIYREENRGKGFGSDAIKLVLKHVFININLESVYLGAYEYNAPAIHLYEKLGFKPIGRRRNARIIGNQYFVEIMMDMISSDYFDLFRNAEMEN